MPGLAYVGGGNDPALVLGRDFDPNVGGGTDRDKLAGEDFAGKDRSFPIKSPQDVADAARSIGRAGADNYDAETLKRNIIRIAKRKGAAFVAKLPQAWQSHAASAALVLSPLDESDVAYVHSMLGSAASAPELLKFEGALLARAERNANGDGLASEAELQELAATLPLMAATDEHHQRAVVGFVINPRVYEAGLYVDGLVYARRFPEVAQGIVSGERHLSLEAFAETATCSECGQVFAAANDYCEHLKDRPRNGATRWLSHLKGIGAGIVRVPAGTNTDFDHNAITFMASIPLVEATPHEVQAMDKKKNGCAGGEDQEPGGDQNPEEDMEKMEEMKAALEKVQAELEARTGELTTAQAEIQTLKAQAETLQASLDAEKAALSAEKTASARALELRDAGFSADEVNGLQASLAAMDQPVLDMLKATKKAAQVTPPDPALFQNKTPAKPNVVLGGDQDQMDLNKVMSLFA